MFYIKSNALQISFDAFHRFEEAESLWRSILPSGHHLLCPDIQATEAAMPEDITFRYVNIMRNGELIGVMYLQCLHFNSKHYHHGIFDRPVLKQLKECIIRQSVHLLICGNLFRVNFQGFYFKDKSDRSLIFDCLQLYRQSLKQDAEQCGILVKDCSREFAPAQFSCYKFKAFDQDLTMELSIRSEWKTFDDYLGDLSRKYRQRAAKIRKAAVGITLSDMDLGMLQMQKNRIHELYMNIVQKQSLALGILNADYFLQMKQHLGEQFKVFGYFKDGQLIAFSSHIYYPQRNKMEIHYIGMDYTQNQIHQLYFNLLFDGIRTAIDGAFDTIEMGRTAREAKANAGAHAVENYNYIWVKPGLIRLAFRFIGNWFEKNIGEDWKNRNPFKSSPGMAESDR